jgi:hypothetical protein
VVAIVTANAVTGLGASARSLAGFVLGCDRGSMLGGRWFFSSGSIEYACILIDPDEKHNQI